MMKCLHILLVMAAFHLAASIITDCPGNSWLFTKCCESRELPNGCVCFSIHFTEFYRRPDCIEDLGVKFHLFTRQSPTRSQVIRSDDNSIASSFFNPALPTTFISHGFTDKGPSPWSTKMMQELLGETEMNVIIVNWDGGAKDPNYLKAAANVWPTGAMVAQLIRVMKIRHGLRLSNVHLIGHSLGAHLSGVAGKEVQRLESEKVGRITGLDPAGPQFESRKNTERLDSSDALFVDIIHTDAEPLVNSGFGIRKSIGHVDFYPNGGKHQPACPKEVGGLLSLLIPTDAGKSAGSCSHIIVQSYFTDSIRQCDNQLFDGNQLCRMGYRASVGCHGDRYPKTSSSRPFCVTSN